MTNSCKHHDVRFDRTLCACDTMHNYCGDCGKVLDDCPYEDAEDDGPRRVWMYRSGWTGPLLYRGGDEWGNRTLAFRLPGERALVVALNIPLRRHFLPMSVKSDPEASTITIGFPIDAPIVRTIEVGRSSVVHFDAEGTVVEVELMRPDALSFASEREALRGVFPSYVVDAMVEFVSDLLELTGRN